MNEKEMLDQLQDLIQDRKSFLTNDYEISRPFMQDIEALEKIIHDYMALRNAVIYSMEERGENFCIWINENIKHRKVKVLSFWLSDFGDIRCHATLYKNRNQVADVIISYDAKEVKEMVYTMYNTSIEKIDKKLINVTFKTLIYDSFDRYLKIQKISKCSNLLKEIYDNVRESETSMCHIDYDDWKNFYSDRYTDRDIEILKNEIKKYGLEEVITINEGEYKIVGYGDLETRFNDNRYFDKSRTNIER